MSTDATYLQNAGPNSRPEFSQYEAGASRKPRARTIMRTILATCLAAATLGVVAPTSATAAGASCADPANLNYHVGRLGNFSSAVFGSSSRIEYLNPDLCGSDADGGGWSSAWVMTAARSRNPAFNNNFDHLGYAQAGYFQTAGAAGYLHGIAEWGQYSRACNQNNSCGASAPFTNVYGDPAGENPPAGYQTYAAVYSSADARIHMYAGGRHLGQNNYNLQDAQQGWDPAWQVQTFGETFEPGSDVPGVATNRADFDRIRSYNSAGNTVDVTNYGVCQSALPARYFCEAYTPGSGGTALRMWSVGP